MKTDELIHLLAADATPVARHRIEQRFALATLAGLVGAGMALMAWFGLRPDLAQAAALPMFWGKLMFAASLAVAGLALLRRMARPGATLGLSAWWLAVPPLVVWAMAAWALWQAAMLNGQVRQVLPSSSGRRSAGAACLWALKGAAPTRLAWSGAGAGLLAGALGTLVYALHCPEMAAPFLAVWYLLGMAIPTAVGAALGPRLLRW